MLSDCIDVESSTLESLQLTRICVYQGPDTLRILLAISHDRISQTQLRDAILIRLFEKTLKDLRDAFHREVLRQRNGEHRFVALRVGADNGG